MDNDFYIIFFVVSNIVNVVGAFLPLETFVSILFDANEQKVFIKVRLYNLITLINDTVTLDADSIKMDGTIKKSIKLSDITKKHKFLFLLKAFHIPIQNIIVSVGKEQNFTDAALTYGIINTAGETIRAIFADKYSKLNISSRLNFSCKSKILYESIISTSIANIIIVIIKKLGEIIWNNTGKKIKFNK